MLKSTGIVRRIDDLGRVVIPKELRRTLGIGNGDWLEIFVTGNQVVLQKYVPDCNICGLADAPIDQVINGTRICKNCVELIRIQQ